MSRNLIKFGRVVEKNEEAIVIDSNETVARRIEILRSIMRESPEESSGEYSDEFFEGIDAEHVEEISDEFENQKFTQPEAVVPSVDVEGLIEEARAEIEQMRSQALAEIEEERLSVLEQAKEIGREEGYQAGFQQATAEMERKEQELQQIENQLKENYEKQIDELEPLLIKELNDIYKYIFAVDFSNNHHVILHLIENVMGNVDGSKDFIVRVSKDDYPFISMQKKQLVSHFSASNCNIEIVEDITMQKGQCLIETDGGLFDCGLDTQLDELEKELMILSYTNNE